MDFHLTREQELIRKMMRNFTENGIKPIAAETGREGPLGAGLRKNALGGPANAAPNYSL